MAARDDEVYRLRRMLDCMTEVVCRFRPDGTILYVNDPYCRMFGRTADELCGSTYAPVVHPDDLARVEAELVTMSPDNPTVVIENRVVLPSGDVRYTQWTNIGFFDAEGNLIECQSAGRDITERVTAERELRRSHERARFLAEASEALASSLELEETLDRVVRLAVPLLADACSVNLLDEEERFQRVAVAHVDAATERALREDQPKISLEDTGALQPLLRPILRGETVVVTALPSETELEPLGSDAPTLRLFRLYEPHSFMSVPLIAHERILGSISLFSSRSHSRRLFGDEDLELAVELGRRAAVAIETAQLYAQLEQASRRKDHFLATLGHELRNPLAAISSALDALSISSRPEVRERALEIARRQITQQKRLVSDLLEVSRFVSGRAELRRELVELREALTASADAHGPVFAGKQQRVRVELPPDPVWAHADPARLEQMVGNLLDNASKYSSEGSEVELALWAEGGTARIRVRDHGVGLESDELSRVFDPFVQAENRAVAGGAARGLGLGLTIVRELAVLHGGHVRVHSAGRGLGSAFEVEIPVAQPPQLGDARSAASAPSAAAHAPSLAYHRVLVVDDNADAADMLADTIRTFGCEVSVEYDGRGAVAAAPRYRPELALIDLGMPEMDGFSTARALRAQAGPECAIVALSGYAQPSDVAAASAAGFDLHLAKPLGLDRLRALLAGDLLHA